MEALNRLAQAILEGRVRLEIEYEYMSAKDEIAPARFRVLVDGEDG